MYAPSPHDNESDVHAIAYDFGSIRRRIIPYIPRTVWLDAFCSVGVYLSRPAVNPVWIFLFLLLWRFIVYRMSEVTFFSFLPLQGLLLPQFINNSSFVGIRNAG